ncbi:uncharacterized protein LOC130798760 [Amaranthus tricolor]|uniref:uncharacterized protein LOC130798760 n=1 Tax=Amaranthus tricolor TaxID=29722 RepID=UPI0025847C32|nr:uncharacterized protein LOC130798760 [Amaranthus tricolor]
MSSEELTYAVQNGDLEFLRNCVASNKPNEHYFKLTKEKSNIFHLAVCSNRLDFIKEAIKILPFKTIQNIFLDQSNEQEMNPLHFAAVTGNIEIVKLILDVYRLSPPLPDIPERPWLAKTVDGASPCHFAIGLGHEACGLEIWRMDMENLSDILVNDGSSLLGHAVEKGFTKMALEMLRSPFCVRCTHSNGYTALHYVAHCSSGSKEEICRRLLERDPEQITQKTIDKFPVLHYWAIQNKLWPFEVLLRSDDIVPNVRKIFVDLMSSIDDKNGFTPLHILAVQDSSSEENVEIAKLLIETCKQEVESSQMSRTLEDIILYLTSIRFR